MKIIADKNIPFLEGVAESYGEVEYLSGSEFSNERIKDADVLIVRTVVRIDEAMLKGTRVKLICSATIGYDHIDTEYCDQHRIVWQNAPGCNSGSVRQYIVSSLIVLSQQKAFDLRDMTIGIVGVGNVGKKVAKSCSDLGMKILLNDPIRQLKESSSDFVSLEEIAEKADIITFHTPLTKEGKFKTWHLADDAFFDSLRRSPIIINSARGAIIDTAALKRAIKVGKVSGTVIDCWENEPNIDLELLQLTDIATPHIAGYSADGKANASRMSLQGVANFFNLDKSYADAITPPLPANRIIDLRNGKATSAILETYNPMTDCTNLKQNPSVFKQLRNEYPLRREYPAYMIINVDNDDERRLLNKLDFELG